jgi:Protein of unknown function (DUF1353)
VSDFLTPLCAQFVEGKTEVWELTTPLRFHLGDATGIEVVDVPVGFRTDGASVPRIFWNLYPPWGPYGKPAGVHDYLYQKRLITQPASLTARRYVERAEADSILRDAMQVVGIGWWTRHVIYVGVRAGGWVTWDKYREAEMKGRPTSGAANAQS